MCGICGFYDATRRPVDTGAPLKDMTRALERRGPDEEGYWHGVPHAAFGHRRLKIIDLETGGQPMTSLDGNATIVFNGEIYNFQEIRQTLEKKGRRFRTRSDTESLLELYAERGIDCVRELKGMFAFSVYDRAKDALVLAVDRFGKKPLYYTQVGDVFLFASGLKSLLKSPLVQKNIDPRALSEYLAFEYVPAPHTILKNVFKLEPATTLEVTGQGIRKTCYWRHDLTPIVRSENEWRDELTQSLERAVEKRLVSDVPLGVFLSGGLDSSAVAYFAQRLRGSRKVKTFTIEFDDPSFDESRYARRVSDYLGTESITEKCTAKRMLDEHETILSVLDEPFADASFIPTSLLCRLARRHVTVALSGDGGDELFSGYPTFMANKLGRALDKWPAPLIKMARAAAGRLPVSFDNISFDYKLKQFFKGMAYTGFRRDQVWLGAFSDRDEMRLLAPELKAEAQHCYDVLDEALDLPAGTDPLQALTAFYFRFYLNGDILVKADRASMAHSLELRAPLLDDDLVEKMLHVPPQFKSGNFTSKYIFKKAMVGRLPDDIIHRKKKGFGIPIARWIRKELKNEFLSVLSAKNLRKGGHFEPGEVESLFQEHFSGKADHRKKLWALYVFQKWMENTL